MFSTGGEKRGLRILRRLILKCDFTAALVKLWADKANRAKSKLNALLPSGPNNLNSHIFDLNYTDPLFFTIPSMFIGPVRGSGDT